MPAVREAEGVADATAEEPLNRKAIIDLANRKLVVTLSRRMHVVAVSRIVRACIREGNSRGSVELHIPHLFCPVCILRPASANLAHAGDRLFPIRTSGHVPLELRWYGKAKN